MNLAQLADKYHKHWVRIMNRATKAPGLTHNRKLGIAYYAQAANAVQQLDESREHSNEGFSMRSVAQLAPEKMSTVKTEVD
jgi:hypothetical protein